MLLDRVLEPDTAHPLVRDLLESLRSARYGEAQFALQAIERQLSVGHEALQLHLSHLMFANALHSHSPFTGFQFLLDSSFDARECSTHLMEHMALGHYFQDRALSLRLFQWLMEHGGLIEPHSKAAWKALAELHPEVFSLNHSRYEAIQLESYIRSQSLEVREVHRL